MYFEVDEIGSGLALEHLYVHAASNDLGGFCLRLKVDFEPSRRYERK
jgi:hypothetical protein